MGYVVKKESLRVVEIESDDGMICFRIAKEENHLLSVTNRSYKPADLNIPRVFPSGHQIDVIERIAQYDEVSQFGKITFPNGVGFERYAFSNVFADEIVWPDETHVIPAFCFLNSHIKKITNIDSVVEVQESAFAFSDFKRFDWPSQCKHIPKSCFYKSMLKEIQNIHSIQSINSSAFASSMLRKLDLIDNGSVVFEPHSLAGLPKECELVLPYYVSKEEVINALK